MNALEHSEERGTTAELLARAHTTAQDGDWKKCLEAIRLVKEFEPRNVYVLAFERQIEQLMELSSSKLLTPQQREDILESIPGIIERALDSPTARPPSGNWPRAADPDTERREKTAALTWLKNQYFQHAHDYVAREQYAHALAEIRRVFILEPENRHALELERQIEELLQLQASKLPGGTSGVFAGVGAQLSQQEEQAKRRRRMRLLGFTALLVIFVLLLLWYLAARGTSRDGAEQAPAGGSSLLHSNVPAHRAPSCLTPVTGSNRARPRPPSHQEYRTV